MNKVFCGECQEILKGFSGGEVDLVFTSPPYFNARKDYSAYSSYKNYLHLMAMAVFQCHRVLGEGRFFVLNISPVLIPRAKRSESSKRLPLQFDFHNILTSAGFEFIDDIIWKKPEGAGWSTSRGRRFSADRNPLQYKPVPVTEYLLVYRKKTHHLIDWNIRTHSDKEAVEQSKIADGYETTNVWEISPARSKDHPAIFPLELAEKVIKYYSFVRDTVLDPFAGSGTTAVAAQNLNRNSEKIEKSQEYCDLIKNRLLVGNDAASRKVKVD